MKESILQTHCSAVAKNCFIFL